jgi:hypothetical protein
MANSINLGDLQKTLTDSMQQLTGLSFSAFKPIMENATGNLSTLTQSLSNFKLQGDDCCRPKNECPPHCIAAIHRQAMPGERILVPFSIKNTCSTVKTWRVGVRELKDADGTMAPEQPVLNKQSVTLEPGRSERVVMMIDLAKFTNGKTYSTEIVLREKDINQNICFTLVVDDSADIVVVSPQNEKKYNLHWQGWETHFYCEKPKAGATNSLTFVNK